jgi:Zn-dependent protease
MRSLILGVLAFFLCIHGLLFGFFNEQGILTSLFLTALVFLPHELGHMAVGRGNFVFSPLLAVMSLLTSYMRIPFVLVGYTEVKNLKGVVAGPLANIILAFLAEIFSVWDNSLSILVFPNVYYAVSNLLPFPPLDGGTIVREKPVLWLLMFAPLLVLWAFH